MTVPSNTIKSGPYAGNGNTNTFSYTFQISDKSQLNVYETDSDGVERLLVVDTNYTVAGIGNENGGIITRTAGNLPTGSTWFVTGDFEYTQLTRFSNVGAFFPTVVEAALDKLTRLVQQVSRASTRFRDGYSGDASPLLPDPAADRVIGWDAQARQLINRILPNQVINITGPLPIQVNTFAALRQIEPAFDGQVITLLGHTMAGTGGGTFYALPASDTSADDDGLTALTAGGRRWRRKDVTVIKGEYFGMYNGLTADVTTKLRAITDAARANRVDVEYPFGDYNFSGQVNCSGIRQRGKVGIFGDNVGTLFTGDGTHKGFVQEGTAVEDVTYNISDIQFKGVTVGLEMRYAVNCAIKRLRVLSSTNGISCGVTGTLGPLFNVFEQLWIDVTNQGFAVAGDSFSNANKVDSSFIRGNVMAASITAGGLGAISTSFLNTEFRGPGLGAVIGDAKATTFDGCYFESEGSSIKLQGFSLSSAVNNCTFGSLKNDTPNSADAFIHHASGAVSLTVSGGYVVIEAGADRNNLRMFKSDAVNSFNLDMMSAPSTEISATGFRLFDTGLPNNRGSINHSDDYTPVWTAALSTQPSLGNGTLTGEYTLSGDTCTVTISLTAGSTTTFALSEWRLTLPFPTVDEAIGSVYIRDSGTGFYHGTARAVSNSSLLTMYAAQGGTSVDNNSPMVWASGDNLVLTITYRFK